MAIISGRRVDTSVTRAPTWKEAAMKLDLFLIRIALAAALAGLWADASVAQQAGQAVDVGTQVPDAAAVKEGLFPEDACKELEASGFKCMGLKPAIRYSLPASSFKIGSAELPDLLKKQLDVFASVLRDKKGKQREIRVVGHADASGSAEANAALSIKRAESVKDYLVKKGADPEQLLVVGVGANDPANPANPTAAENRRVEIGRSPKP